MKKKKSLKSLIINLAILIPTAISAIYIMVQSLGLSDKLDFGAGAYYYADMPGFQQWTDAPHYQSPVPMWVLILLFLAWGALMWKLWIFIDKKSGKNG
ncbi:MAG: hypothetical protein U0L49_05915 [Eubacterium sp.]|nr:hypothetical protein [Eubacterium sp.]